jgi:hypothetical protein
MTNSPRPPQTRRRPTLGEIDLDVLVRLPGNEPTVVGKIRVPIHAVGAGNFSFDVHDEIRAVEDAAREALGKFAIVEIVEEEPKVMTAGEIVEADFERLAQQQPWGVPHTEPI